MASLDDILTTQKNGVVALGNIAQINKRVAGTNTSSALTASTQVNVGPARLVSLSVIVAGSAAGGVYNSATTGGAGTGNQICAIPNTVGVFQIGAELTAGIVVTPGSGQTVAVTYTPGA